MTSGRKVASSGSRAIGEHLVTELRAAAADTVVWTWNPSDQSAAFVARRTSNELAVHRVDMQLARGAAEPVDAELAVDGIEEIIVIMTRGRPVDPALRPTTRQTLHLHGTDYEPSEWFDRARSRRRAGHPRAREG